MGASSANGAADRAAFVRAEVIHDNDVAGAQRRSEHLFDISLETFAVDWTVEDAGRIDAFAAQRRHEGQGFPMAVRNLGMELNIFALKMGENKNLYATSECAPSASRFPWPCLGEESILLGPQVRGCAASDTAAMQAVVSWPADVWPDHFTVLIPMEPYGAVCRAAPWRTWASDVHAETRTPAARR
jgi:hypothetical protein